MAIRRNRLDRVRGIHRQSGRIEALREEAADAMVSARCASIAANTDPRARRDARARIPAMVS